MGLFAGKSASTCGSVAGGMAMNPLTYLDNDYHRSIKVSVGGVGILPDHSLLILASFLIKFLSVIQTILVILITLFYEANLVSLRISLSRANCTPNVAI